MTMAAGQGSTDAENGVEMTARDLFGETSAQGQDGQGLEVYGDSHYGSGQARADYQASWHDTVIKPGRCARRCPACSPSMASSSMRSRAR